MLKKCHQSHETYGIEDMNHSIEKPNENIQMIHSSSHCIRNERITRSTVAAAAVAVVVGKFTFHVPVSVSVSFLERACTCSA